MIYSPYNETLGDSGGDDAPAGVTITSNGSANTKGTWTSIGTPTFDSQLFWLCMFATDTAADYLVDIGVDDGAGNVYTKVDNIRGQFLRIENQIGAVDAWEICLRGGQEVFARCQDSVGGASLQMTLQLFNNGLRGRRGFDRAIAIGADTAASRGTSLTRASLTEITSSGPALDIRALKLGVGTDGATSWGGGLDARYTILRGSSGNEHSVIPPVQFQGSSSIDGHLPWFTPTAPCLIPPSSRLTGLYESNFTSTTADAIVYGFVG